MSTTQEWVLLEGRRCAVKPSQIINHLLINEAVVLEFGNEVYFAKGIDLFKFFSASQTSLFKLALKRLALDMFKTYS
jgi:hypothetical protein